MSNEGDEQKIPAGPVVEEPPLHKDAQAKDDPAAAKIKAEDEARGLQSPADEEAPEPVIDEDDENEAAAAPKPTAPKKPKRQVNPRYKDVRETGSWGKLSRKELVIAGVVFGLVVVGVIVAVVVLVTGGDDGDGETKIVQAPTSPPVEPVNPNAVTAAEELALVSEAIAANEHVSSVGEALSSCGDVACFEGLQNDDTANPSMRALSWLLHEDSRDDKTETVVRFALAGVYYTLGGPEWTNSEGWLESGLPVCDWYGVECSRSGAVDEVDLSGNNLVGEIPDHFALLTQIQALWLRDNKLSGPIPGESLGSIPTLSILYMENNMLSGSVPSSLRNNGVLQTLFIFGNDLTGLFPRAFCPPNIAAPPVLLHFGLDCQELVCTCCDDNNCY